MPFYALLKAFFTLALYLTCAFVFFQESVNFGLSERVQVYTASPVFVFLGVPALVCGVLVAFSSPRHNTFSFLVQSALLGAASFIGFLLAYIALRGAGSLLVTHGESGAGILSTSLERTVGSAFFGLAFGLLTALPALVIRPLQADIGDGELFYYAGRVATVLVCGASLVILLLLVAGRWYPALKVF